MQKSLKVGEEYLLRDARMPDAPVQRIWILQHVGGIKNPGLADHVESKNVLIRWKDRKPVLRDEQSECQLRTEIERQR